MGETICKTNTPYCSTAITSHCNRRHHEPQQFCHSKRHVSSETLFGPPRNSHGLLASGHRRTTMVKMTSYVGGHTSVRIQALHGDGWSGSTVGGTTNAVTQRISCGPVIFFFITARLVDSFFVTGKWTVAVVKIMNVGPLVSCFFVSLSRPTFSAAVVRLYKHNNTNIKIRVAIITQR